MRYGFVIDQDRCIGCHACTVACKDEHKVPVGVFRTWVKYIEKGSFPNTSRHFGVMRCNHCEQAPCIEICPTSALFKRDNGIVDFDNSRCIGCKSCMQACPYDALYIDPATSTAAKCNFCAHRVEANLEPACVVVCPTQAIMTGDLDDPQSRVSRIVATGKVATRKAHKGTQPKLFYVGIEGDLLQPSMMRPEHSSMWADHNPLDGRRPATGDGAADAAPGSARIVYDVPHAAPWGAIPAAYLWTKSIAAGVLMVAALVLGMERGAEDGMLLASCEPNPCAAFSRHHGGAADRRPQAAVAFLLLDHQAQLSLVAGLGHVHPDDLRRARDGVARLRLVCRFGSLRADDRDGDFRDRLRVLLRFSVRAGQGARSVAESGLHLASAGAGADRRRGAC